MTEKRNAGIVFIFITLLIDVIGFGIIIPVVPQLIQNLAHCDMSEAAWYGGWLTSVFAIMQFLFAPIIGGLSDQYGRRPVLLASLFIFGIDYILLGFAPNITWLFIGRILAGITGASFSTATAYIADISTAENRAQNFGMVGAAFGLGFIIGPVLGGFISIFGERVPFFVAAGLALVNWLYGYFILPESLKPENRRKFDIKRANPLTSIWRLGKYKGILGLVAALFFIYMGGHANQSSWSFIMIEKYGWTQQQIGFSLAWVGFMVGAVQGGLSRIIIPKLGQEKSAYIGLAVYSLGFFLFAFAAEGWMIYPFMTIFAFGGIAGPALQSLIAGQVAANEQGEMQGTLASIQSITSIFGPFLMNNILFNIFAKKDADLYFPSAPFFAGGVLCLISFLIAYLVLRNKKVESGK